MAQRLLHPCIFAKGNNGFKAYQCEKKCSNCTAQFYCHTDKYWKPMYQIKCPDFISKNEKVGENK